jgi:hypothetical protein
VKSECKWGLAVGFFSLTHIFFGVLAHLVKDATDILKQFFAWIGMMPSSNWTPDEIGTKEQVRMDTSIFEARDYLRSNVRAGGGV